MENKNKKNNNKALLGIIILTIGTLLLLDNFNVLDLDIKHYIFSWKTLLIGIGIALLASSSKNTGGIILISLGVVFWLPTILDYQVTLKQILWPSVLIIVGIVMLSKVRDLNGKRVEATKPSTDEVSDVTIIYPAEKEEKS